MTVRCELARLCHVRVGAKCADETRSEKSAADWKGHRIHAVDGSKINLPRALIKAGYRCPSDNAYYPQGMVSCLYRLKTQLPVDFDIVAHGDERSLARSHLCALKAADGTTPIM